MKKLITLALIILSFTASAQLTLSEKSALATDAVMQARVFQALFSKANYWLGQTATNLKTQKQIAYANTFVKGSAGGLDIRVITNYWLSGYNGVPILDSKGQPIDSQILNSAQLDTVFDTLAGVVAGDNLLPLN
jgi:hypothetical protein